MKKYRVNVNGTDYEITLEALKEGENFAPKAAPAPAAPAAPTPAPAAPAAPVQGETITSPMPGTILDVQVSVGTTVSEGQVLMILEAMKMENEIVAPQDGSVAQIVVTPGVTVDTGAPLLVLA